MEEIDSLQTLKILLFYSNDMQAQKDDLSTRLEVFQADYPFALHCVLVDESPFLGKALARRLPRLEVGDLALESQMDSVSLAVFFEEAKRRSLSAPLVGNPYTNFQAFSKKEKMSLSLKRHYPVWIALFLFLYLGFAFLAPVMMKTGHSLFAQRIYAFYRPFCHQLAFRSFFLFGKQPFYPIQLAGIKGMQSYGEASGQLETDISAASHFVGNEEMGYKTALCQRDIAIYSGLLLISLLFIFLRYKVHNIPWQLWVILGLLPVALDGGLQMISALPFSFMAWLPARESTPFLRVFTGGLFGIMTAWYGLFTMDEIVFEKQTELEKRAMARKEKKN
ncbi:MAG: DUF2085 domain-containing protein [Anaerolineaceae bacterium]|nr:DUF2085 domain-containing protein [Anaerolineaceae bacterium]